MKACSLLVVSTAVLLWGALAEASEPVGFYAVLDKVVFEPREGSPERVQVWGAFVPMWANHPNYDQPHRGYLYYSLTEEMSASEKVAARNEWADLRSVAGTGQFISFASSSYVGWIRSGCEPREGPNPYPLNVGVIRIRSDTDYPPVTALRSMPTPVSPEDGATSVAAGQVTLAVRNLRDAERSSAGYVFEISDGHGGVERSPLVPSGQDQTGWSPAMKVRAGRQYTWSAWATEGDWTGPLAGACFELRFLRGDANADSLVDISDAVSVLEHLFLGGPPPRPPEAGDINGSGAVDLSDAIYLLNHLFLGGSPPPAPFPEAGLIP